MIEDRQNMNVTIYCQYDSLTDLPSTASASTTTLLPKLNQPSSPLPSLTSSPPTLPLPPRALHSFSLTSCKAISLPGGSFPNSFLIYVKKVSTDALLLDIRSFPTPNAGEEQEGIRIIKKPKSRNEKKKKSNSFAQEDKNLPLINGKKSQIIHTQGPFANSTTCSSCNGTTNELVDASKEQFSSCPSSVLPTLTRHLEDLWVERSRQQQQLSVFPEEVYGDDDGRDIKFKEKGRERFDTLNSHFDGGHPQLQGDNNHYYYHNQQRQKQHYAQGKEGGKDDVTLKARDVEMKLTVKTGPPNDYIYNQDGTTTMTEKRRRQRGPPPPPPPRKLPPDDEISSSLSRKMTSPPTSSLPEIKVKMGNEKRQKEKEVTCFQGNNIPTSGSSSSSLPPPTRFPSSPVFVPPSAAFSHHCHPLPPHLTPTTTALEWEDDDYKRKNLMRGLPTPLFHFPICRMLRIN